MVPYSHPVTGQNFVNRIDLLQSLKFTYVTDNMALVGPRRIGKSSVAKQFLLQIRNDNVFGVYFDISKNLGTPGKFAVRLLKEFLKAYVECTSAESVPEIEDLDFDIAQLKTVGEKIESAKLANLARLLTTYPLSPDTERDFFERIFKFFEEFSLEKELMPVIILDEFQEIEALEAYKGFGPGRILGLLSGLFSEQENVRYVLTGSQVRIIIDILENEKSPFYGRIYRFNVGRFCKSDTATLMNKCVSRPVHSEAFQLVYALSKGHPYYTVVISRKADRIAEPPCQSSGQLFITVEHVREAFEKELHSGMLGHHCAYLYETSLGKARSDAFLRELLRELARGEIGPTQLAERVGRLSGYLSRYLRTLYNLDLIDKVEGNYKIADHILEIWLRAVYEREEPDLKLIRRKIDENYREFVQSLSTESGMLFESYMREMLSKCGGKQVGQVRYPVFSSVEGINFFDREGDVFANPSNIEIDALCLGEEENWMCEFKYSQKSPKTSDIAILRKKARSYEKTFGPKIHRLLWISRFGPAQGAAADTDVLFLSFEDVNKILKASNMKKISHALEDGR